MTVLAFVGAAAIGGLVRWRGVHLNREGWPFGTLLVNVVAAFVAGLSSGLSTTAALILVTAYLGSMSTFSTVVGEVVDLDETHGRARATGYAAVTSAAGIGAAWIGLAITA